MYIKIIIFKIAIRIDIRDLMEKSTGKFPELHDLNFSTL